jgi:hypothetical protein
MEPKKKKKIFMRAGLIGISALLLLLNGCYSFTGSSVPPHLKTVAIPLFEDVSGFGEPGLREQFTQQLIQLFINDNSLELGDRLSSDCVLEGTITTVTDVPSVIAAGEQVTTRKVTVTVHATFTDMKFRKKVWEKDFSNYGEYQQGTETRSVALDKAVKNVAEDILLETVSGW